MLVILWQLAKHRKWLVATLLDQLICCCYWLTKLLPCSINMTNLQLFCERCFWYKSGVIIEQHQMKTPPPTQTCKSTPTQSQSQSQWPSQTINVTATRHDSLSTSFSRKTPVCNLTLATNARAINLFTTAAASAQSAREKKLLQDDNSDSGYQHHHFCDIHTGIGMSLLSQFFTSKAK